MNIHGNVIEAGNLEHLAGRSGIVITAPKTQLAEPQANYFGKAVVVITEADFAELKAYREGGVTEEMLRRNDGFIKVGRGCEIAIAGTTERCQPPAT